MEEEQPDGQGYEGAARGVRFSIAVEETEEAQEDAHSDAVSEVCSLNDDDGEDSKQALAEFFKHRTGSKDTVCPMTGLERRREARLVAGMGRRQSKFFGEGHERRSSIAARLSHTGRRSLSSMLNSTLLKAAANTQEESFNGPFIDFMLREKAKGFVTDSLFHGMLDKDSVAFEAEIQKPSDIMRIGSNQMTIEKLVSTLSEEVTEFWKGQNNPAWSFSSANAWGHMRYLTKNLEQAKATKNSTLRVIMIDTIKQVIAMKSRLVSEKEESVLQRHERRQVFWSQLHEGAGKADVDVRRAQVSAKVRRQTSAVMLPSVSPSHGSCDRAARAGGLLLMSPGPPFAPTRSSAFLHEAATCSRGVWEEPHWKERAARSKCTIRRPSSPTSRVSSPLGRLSDSRPGSQAQGRKGKNMYGLGETFGGGSEASSNASWSRLGSASGSRTRPLDNSALFDAAEEELEELFVQRGMGCGGLGGSRGGAGSMPFGSSLASSMTALPHKKQSHRWWQNSPFCVGDDEEHQDPSSLASRMKTRNRMLKLEKSCSLPSLSNSITSASQDFEAEDFWDDEEDEEEDDEDAEAGLHRQLPMKQPRVQSTFRMPWLGESSGQQDLVTKKSKSMTKRYLQACRDICAVPNPMPLVTGHSLSLNVAEKNFNDADLAAITCMLLGGAADLEHVNLDGGTLSVPAMEQFLQALLDCPAAASLSTISLKRIRCLGLSKPATSLMSVLQGTKNLKVLDLSGVPLNIRSHQPLCEVIRDHPSLAVLSLSSTGLGGGVKKASEEHLANKCVRDIMSCRTLRSLDLSWNCFTAEVFTKIGEALIEIGALEDLSIASSAGSIGANQNLSSPVAYFLEIMASNKSLTRLDVSMNKLDFRGMLILESALMHNRILTNLLVSDNSLGTMGIRSMMRLLSYSTSGLMKSEFKGCSTGQSSGAKTDMMVYRATNPAGRYRLDLSLPYHRALLRMLYNACARFGTKPEDAFKIVSFSEKSYSHPQKDADGVYHVLRSGKLEVTFNVDPAREAVVSNLDPSDFANILLKQECLTRITIPPAKELTVIAQWYSIDGKDEEQKVMLEALSKDFTLSYPQMAAFCKNKVIAADVLCSLFHCTTGGIAERYFCSLLAPNVHGYVRLLERQRSTFYFNCENPTGRYKLDLCNVADFAVAEKVILLDSWEITLKRRVGRTDSSQLGNYSQLRNPRYNDMPLPVGVIGEWILPEVGELEFDYTSARRPPVGVPTFSDVYFTNMMITLQSEDGTSPQNLILALRMISHNMYITSLQMRELLGCFLAKGSRIEVCVIFFNRVADIWNEKLFRVRLDGKEELMKRIGPLSFCPFIQIDQAQFTLDFANNDERILGNMLCLLCGKEARTGIRDYSYTRTDGSLDPMALGIPRSWDSVEKMPRNGVFTCTYLVAPEQVVFKARRDNLERLGGWATTVNEDEVMWWGGLDESPPDVLEFLNFLCAHYDDIWQAFTLIDGEDGNGVLTLQEFNEGYHEMGCKKYDGPNEFDRIKAVFRFLDPSGEGEVSKDEWGILDRTFQEIKLCIYEFCQFLNRTFGPDLAESWQFLDADGSGEIDIDEWMDAVTNIGYFGPSHPIFKFLDKDDEGTVSYDEFLLLDTLKVKDEAIGPK